MLLALVKFPITSFLFVTNLALNLFILVVLLIFYIGTKTIDSRKPLHDLHSHLTGFDSENILETLLFWLLDHSSMVCSVVLWFAKKVGFTLVFGCMFCVMECSNVLLTFVMWNPLEYLWRNSMFGCNIPITIHHFTLLTSVQCSRNARM